MCFSVICVSYFFSPGYKSFLSLFCFLHLVVVCELTRWRLTQKQVVYKMLLWFGLLGVFNDFILMYFCLCTVMYICAMYFQGYSETLWINILAYLVCVKIKLCRNDELG